MGAFAILQEKFGTEKRFTRLVAVRKPCRLGFVELLAYSTLIFRVDEHGCTASRLALMTGLHQSVTVPKTLARLAGFGLVVQSADKRWSAVAPPESITGWFVLKKAEQLRNQFGYNWIGVPAPDSPLTNLQAAIITQLVLKRSHAQIGRFLRVSLKTVARTVKVLAENGNKFKRAWFQDKGKVEKKTARQPAQQTDQGEAPKKTGTLAQALGLDEYHASQLDRNCRLMRAAGYEEKKTTNFWMRVLGAMKDPNSESAWGLLYGFPDKFGRIEADHKANVKKGAAVGPVGYRLLCSEYGVSP